MSTANKPISFLLLLLIITGGGFGLWYYLKLKESPILTAKESKTFLETTTKQATDPTTDPKDLIQAEYQKKIVYTNQENIDLEILKTDCEERDGKFNYCGSVCGPEVDSCITTCAYTCEFEEPIRENFFGNRQDYVSEDLGFKLTYPSVFKLDEDLDSVKFILSESNQVQENFFSSGVIIHISQIINIKDNLEDYINSSINETNKADRIINDPKKIIVNGINGYQYKILSDSETTVLFLTKDSSNQIIRISYSAPDPRGVGYDNLARQAVNSFQFLDQVKETVAINLYYPNLETKDEAKPCDVSAIYPVERIIEKTDNYIQETLKLLLNTNLSSAEKQTSLFNNFSEIENFNLISYNLNQGVLNLKFDGPILQNTCQANLLEAQIRKTANQFFSVKEVRLSPDSLFQF